MTTSDRNLQRIAALLRQSESTDNPHEAHVFLTRAQELATHHSIDLALARATDTGPTRSTPIARQITIGERGTRGLATYVRLFLAISGANDVRVDIAHDSTWVMAFGMETDIATVELLYTRLLTQMVRASRAYLRSRLHRTKPKIGTPVHGTTARIAFQNAFADKIGERLTTARDATRAHMIATTDTSASGPSAALVLRDKQIEVTDFYQRNSRARGSWNPDKRRRRRPAPKAAIAGRQAGQRARLTDQPALPAPHPRLRS